MVLALGWVMAADGENQRYKIAKISSPRRNGWLVCSVNGVCWIVMPGDSRIIYRTQIFLVKRHDLG